MMKIDTPLDGEPYSIEEIRQYLRAAAELTDEINRTNAKLKELKLSFGKK